MDTNQASILQSNRDLNQQFTTIQDNTIQWNQISLNQHIDTKFGSII